MISFRMCINAGLAALVACASIDAWLGSRQWRLQWSYRGAVQYLMAFCVTTFGTAPWSTLRAQTGSARSDGEMGGQTAQEAQWYGMMARIWTLGSALEISPCGTVGRAHD